MVSRPFHLAFAGAALLGALVSSSPPAQAQAPGPLPPGLEGAVADLVFDADDRTPLPFGFRVAGAEIGVDRITVSLSGEAGEFRVVLMHPDAMPPRVVGRTPSFVVALASVTGADVEGAEAVGGALAARVSANDDGTFWSFAEGPSPRVRDAGGATPSTLVDRTRRAVGWVGLLGILFFFAAMGIRRANRDGPDWRRGSVVAGLFIAAFALRLALPPWAPVHSNDHGIAELRGLSGAVTGSAHEARQYGDAYLEVVRPLATLLGDDPHFVLGLGAFFGALTVLGLYLLAQRLFVDRPAAALIAAAGLALDPAHVRLSLSESPRVLAMLLMVIGLVLGIGALGDGSRRVRFLAAWGAGFAFALSAELRFVTLFFPIAGAVFLGLGIARRGQLRDVAGVFAAPILWAAFAVYGHATELAPLLAESTSSPRPWNLQVFGQIQGDANILFDTMYTPVVSVITAAVGAFALVRGGRWRLVLASLLAWAPLYGPALWVRACRTDTLRYQTDLHLPLFLLAGAAILLVPRDHPRSRLLAVSVLLVVGLGSVPGLVDAAEGDVQSANYRAAVDGAPAPPDVIVIAPPAMTDERVRTEFPDYAVAEPERIRDGGRGPGCWVFVGVSCWSFARDEDLSAAPRVAGGPFRAECTALLGGLEGAEAAVASLPAVAVPHRRGEFHVIPAERPRIGYAPCSDRSRDN